MNQSFHRAKSPENKKIRMQEIMERADMLFQTCNYHEITLSMIGKELGIGRSALYKYVTSKEEIFLAIIIEKQKAVMDSIVDKMSQQNKTMDVFAKTVAHILYQHLDFIGYFEILTTILETNVSLEALANFKVRSAVDSKELYNMIKELTHLSNQDTFNLFLSILHHAVCLSNRINLSDAYIKVMKMNHLPIYPIDFERELADFIQIYALNYHKYY